MISRLTITLEFTMAIYKARLKGAFTFMKNMAVKQKDVQEQILRSQTKKSSP